MNYIEKPIDRRPVIVFSQLRGVACGWLVTALCLTPYVCQLSQVSVLFKFCAVWSIKQMPGILRCLSRGCTCDRAEHTWRCLIVPSIWSWMRCRYVLASVLVSFGGRTRVRRIADIWWEELQTFSSGCFWLIWRLFFFWWVNSHHEVLQTGRSFWFSSQTE